MVVASQALELEAAGYMVSTVKTQINEEQHKRGCPDGWLSREKHLLRKPDDLSSKPGTDWKELHLVV